MYEKVLLVCTSSEPNTWRAISVLRERVFQEPQIYLLCTLRDLAHYEKSAHFREVLVFPPRHRLEAILRLTARISRERYYTVAVLWCLEPGWNRPKLFAMACGWPRLLVFNENLDCDFLRPRFLWRLLSARYRNGTLFNPKWGRALVRPAEEGSLAVLSLLLFPIRLVFLLALTAELYLKTILTNRNRNVTKTD